MLTPFLPPTPAGIPHTPRSPASPFWSASGGTISLPGGLGDTYVNNGNTGNFNWFDAAGDLAIPSFNTTPSAQTATVSASGICGIAVTLEPQAAGPTPTPTPTARPQVGGEL